jgi:hypothetical protein
MPFGMPTTTKYFLPAADASRQTWRWDHLGHARSHGGRCRPRDVQAIVAGCGQAGNGKLAADPLRAARSPSTKRATTARRRGKRIAPHRWLQQRGHGLGAFADILRTPKRTVVKTPILDRVRRTALWLNAKGRTDWL